MQLLDLFIVIAIFSSLLVVPYLWVKIRGERAGDPEGSYPDPSVKPTPSEEFGEFQGEGLPTAEAGVYGPTRSTPSYWTRYFTQRVWVHPDYLQLLDFLRKTRMEIVEDKDQQSD